MNKEARELIASVTKHLVTITVASIGFLVTLMFTTFKDNAYMISAQISLFSLLACVVFSVLTQMSIVGDALEEKPWVSWLSPKAFLFLAWTCLVIGVSAFVIFTWANINLGGALAS